jgi:hypothetical protein
VVRRGAVWFEVRLKIRSVEQVYISVQQQLLYFHDLFVTTQHPLIILQFGTPDRDLFYNSALIVRNGNFLRFGAHLTLLTFRSRTLAGKTF